MREVTGVLLVSNRGPVSFVATDDDFEVRRGAGGLAGAVDSVARRLRDKTAWIAAATSEADRNALAAGAAGGLSELLGYPVHLINIDADTYSEYYDIVSNRMLWFANHCMFDELGIEGFGEAELKAWRGSYETTNRRFAHAAIELAGRSDLVAFQDYHLTRAPLYLRAERPDQPILHFTHSSFCGPESYGVLPEEVARGVIEGMLAADLVGFHVSGWAANFLDCCEWLGIEVDRGTGTVTHEGRRTWVRTYPIPIDAKDLHERASGESARLWAKRFASEAAGALIARADRAEPSKNIVRGFRAFGLLLDRHAELRGMAHFVACLYPTRESMAEYQSYAEEIHAIVDEVNARHPDSIRLFMSDDYDRSLGALVVYDVLLVNSLMDGMNLVSKEGAVLNANEGVIALSSGAGSFEELGDHALIIEDPRDVEQTADVLERALRLGYGERARRATALRARAQQGTPQGWIDAQLDDLSAIVADGEPVSPAPRT